MRQSDFLAILPIKDGETEQLRNLLAKIGRDIDGNGLIAFDRFRTVHFMRFVILPAAHNGCISHDRLVLSTNHDDTLANHLDDVFSDIDNARNLCAIFAHCKGIAKSPSPHSVRSTLLAHRMRSNAFYVGAVERDVQTIRNEEELRRLIQGFLDTRDWSDYSALQVFEQIKIFLTHQSDIELNWLQTQPRHSTWSIQFFRSLIEPLLGVLALVAFILVSSLIGWWYGGTLGFFIVLGSWLIIGAAGVWYLRFLEAQDRERKWGAATPRHAAALMSIEDYQVQNQMTHLVPIKTGRFRLFLLRAVLGVINLKAMLTFTKGELGGIMSIHFARWVIIDKGRHLLFLSNFDGSWESYLGDFIDKLSKGLTAVWSNTAGFPRTKLLVRGGASNAFVFKASVRDSQLVTDVWYSAYPHLTIQNVMNNAHIRRGLESDLTNEEVRQWLARF